MELDFLRTSVLENLLIQQKKYMVAEGYVSAEIEIVRNEAMTLIAQLSRDEDVSDSYIPYLALTIFDRFVSKMVYLGIRIDNVRVYAICCLTIAWKVRDHVVTIRIGEFLTQNNLGHLASQMEDMEFAILEGLDWRLRDLTATAFLNFFQGNNPAGASIRSITEIIIQTAADIAFTSFEPSVIAASAIVVACKIAHEDPAVYQDCINNFLVTNYFDEMDLRHCIDKSSRICELADIQVELGNPPENVPLRNFELKWGRWT